MSKSFWSRPPSSCAAGFTPDELFIRDADSLQPLTVDSQRAVVLMAAWLGKARLIDNQQVDLTL